MTCLMGYTQFQTKAYTHPSINIIIDLIDYILVTLEILT